MTLDQLLALPFIIAGILLVILFWGAIGTLIVSALVALFTGAIAKFGVLLGIFIAVLVICYIIGMASVI